MEGEERGNFFLFSLLCPPDIVLDLKDSSRWNDAIDLWVTGQADGGQTQLRRASKVKSERRITGLHNNADTNLIPEQLTHTTISSPLITHHI